MKIKKYEVSDMKEALKQIKSDLGPHAVILTTRKIMKSTGLGLFPRPVLEVTAAVDFDRNAIPAKPAQPKKLPAQSASHHHAGNAATYGSNVTPTAPAYKKLPETEQTDTDYLEDIDDDEYIRSLLGNSRNKFPQSTTNSSDSSDLLPKEGEEPYIPPPKESAVMQSFHSAASSGLPADDSAKNTSIDKIAEMIESLGLDKLSKLADDIDDIKKQLMEIKGRETPTGAAVDLPNNLKEYYSLLVKNGVDEVLAYRFLKSLTVKIPDLPGRAQLKNLIQQELIALIPFEADYLVSLRGKVALFVGPTGVGKTTTIAKIAADLVLRYSQRVCLITTDMFRIGAVEQLKTYAEIADIKLYVATNPEELARIISEVSGEYDYILTDSTGRSPYDNVKIADIAAYAQTSPLIMPILVLSMATNHNELGEAYERYGELKPAYIVFTKLDETRYFGPMFNIPAKKKTPILLLSAGQKVPDDMETPDGKKIAKKLLQEIPALWNDN